MLLSVVGIHQQVEGVWEYDLLFSIWYEGKWVYCVNQTWKSDKKLTCYETNLSGSISRNDEETPCKSERKKQDRGYAACHSASFGFSPNIEMKAGRLSGI